MQALVDDVKQQIADQAAAHPEFQGMTAAVVTGYEGMFVYGPEDPRSRMLVDLGFTFPSEVFGSDMDEFGESLSTERVSDLDQVGVAVWLDYESDPAAKKVFEQTTTEQEGRWFDIAEADGNYYVAHSFVTPLSIPYVLERYVPQLAAAADGDPVDRAAGGCCLTSGAGRVYSRAMAACGRTGLRVPRRTTGTTTGRPLRGSSSTSARSPNTSSSRSTVKTSRGGPWVTTTPSFITTTRSL